MKTNPKLCKADITRCRVDAIVNAANSSLLGGDGVDGAIHAAAGLELLKECMTLGGCEVGQAKITNGYNLPAKYVIHTVGPIWNGGGSGEKELLENCYNNSVALAREHGLRQVAFPLISSGAYGYPIKEALHVAISALSKYNKSDIDIILVLYDDFTYNLAEEIFAKINLLRGV